MIAISKDKEKTVNDQWISKKGETKSEFADRIEGSKDSFADFKIQDTLFNPNDRFKSKGECK